jgi:hypothetical protein
VEVVIALWGVEIQGVEVVIALWGVEYGMEVVNGEPRPVNSAGGRV